MTQTAAFSSSYGASSYGSAGRHGGGPSAPSVPADNNSSPLEQVRQMKKPTYEEMLRRSDHYFWQRYGVMLGHAWEEWETENEGTLPNLSGETVLYDDVVKTFQEAWKDPSKEENVRKLWEEVAPGVYKIKFFDPEKVAVLRQYFDMAAQSGVPCRPPYGITLNRKGFMLDERSPGYLAVPTFQRFYRDLIDKYMRPSGRLLYPEFINANDDSESFAFSIQYQPDKDHSIRQHTDASALTFNINMNLPDEEFTGSGLYFVDPQTGNKKHVSFGLGEAIVHRGATQHAALPITSGTRSNLVMWLYGPQGRFNYMSPYEPEEQLSREDRWTMVENASSDMWAPF